MKKAKINDMKKGWFIGNFEPTLYKTNDCEIGIKVYKSGEREEAHYHKIATEYTVVIDGKIRMFNEEFIKGDIVIVEPGDATDFLCIEDASTVVVKIPGANNDKYLV